MRGKGDGRNQSLFNYRITPAYAGKRPTFTVAVSPVQDHPRLCGEKQRNHFVRQLENRITPAYAGKSFKEWARAND